MLDQLAFDLRIAEPMARSSDPQTSKDAASAAKELQRHHHAVILSALKLGPAGKDAIADRTGLSGVQVCRRLAELARASLIVPTGRTVPSTSGRQEREWERS